MHSLRHYLLSLCLLFAAIPPSALADGYDMFSKHEELKGHVVADAGDFEKINPPFGTIGATAVLKLNSNCFKPIGSLGLWGIGKKAGLVLVDRSKSISIALLESSIGSIKVETVAAMQIACPTEDSSGLPLDPQQRLQELKRRQEILQLQLERLRQQQNN